MIRCYHWPHARLTLGLPRRARSQCMEKPRCFDQTSCSHPTPTWSDEDHPNASAYNLDLAPEVEQHKETDCKLIEVKTNELILFNLNSFCFMQEADRLRICSEEKDSQHIQYSTKCGRRCTNLFVKAEVSIQRRAQWYHFSLLHNRLRNFDCRTKQLEEEDARFLKHSSSLCVCYFHSSTCALGVESELGRQNSTEGAKRFGSWTGHDIADSFGSIAHTNIQQSQHGEEKTTLDRTALELCRSVLSGGSKGLQRDMSRNKESKNKLETKALLVLNQTSQKFTSL